ncbi:sigma-54-dependent Fis family transcriptional regulator [Segetibacter sp. 3557_3]|uniref:sigma-54-dependent transcriptional regulator n=1 Tax=Segetibacter sp. 3557_3 TaxID=2547429 RepID=UPI001058A120|nr:sigma-54 dependent transcriptional regulator [Segetibacter sp. 3557_3]TDH27388.1 sigma-54-dependent Fis family transcriptional regulator [Segetibacter sp. 3557_3]
MLKILLVEDDLTFAKILEGFLKRNGYEVDAKTNIKSALQAIENNNYDLFLLDYRLPDGTGLDLLSTLSVKQSAGPVIMMTSFNDVRTAVKAMRSGVFEYITKPVNPEELLMIINEASKRDPVDVAAPPKKKAFIEGNSKIAQRLSEHIRIVAPTDMSVLIVGESGTGKEHVARSIHEFSTRNKKPFVAVDCGTLSKELAGSELFGHVKGAFTGAALDKTGVFELASGGTVFLDEIGNLGYDVQIKLLRMLQERVIQPVGGTKQVNVDIRLITATNDNLLNSIANGGFREDIYHRINEFKIQVPPLRSRGDDLRLFVTYFIEQANAELGRSVKAVSAEAMRVFEDYDWPGNLRELRNVIKRMVLLSKSDIAGTDVLPEEMIDTIDQQSRKPTVDLKAIQEVGEKETIAKVLLQTRYNKTKAAKLLNIDRKTLYYKMEQYGIE